MEELLDPGHRHDPRPRLVRLAYVLHVPGARGDRLGDLRVQLVEPRVHRAELLVVQTREVLDLDAEGLHGDLELDQRLLGRPHGPLQPLLGPRLRLGRRLRGGLVVGIRIPGALGPGILGLGTVGLAVLGFRGRHPTRLGHGPARLAAFPRPGRCGGVPLVAHTPSSAANRPS